MNKQVTALGSLKHGLRMDDMTRHGLVMAFFSILGGIFSYLYQLSMGMLLSPENYGILYSLFSLFTIVAVLTQTISITVANFVSKAKAQGKLSGVSYLWRFFLKRTFILGLGLFLVLALLSPLISRFLGISSNLYPIVIFTALIVAFIYPTNLGVLQGLQRFLPLGTTQTFWNLSKLFFGAVLVYLGLGLFGALLAIPLSFLLACLIGLFFLRDIPRYGNEAVDTGRISTYMGLAFFAFLGFTALINVDVILARHFIPELSGDYSAISVLGKIAFYAPAGIAFALFPKTSGLFALGKETRPMLGKATLLCLLIAGVVVIIYLCFPELVANFFFRGKYPLIAPYLFKYGLAMALSSLCFLLINYLLSLNQTKVAYPLLGVVAVELGLLFLFHANISQFVDVMLISSFLSVAFILPFCFITPRHPVTYSEKT
ncbi:MAG: oligosaccharide flippase family protein [Desulfobacterales bacterium]|nr:oligosaccharide flippase family protein [Desulfobacterales bacterium]